MHVRHALTASLGLFMLIMEHAASPQSQAQYAEQRVETWKQANASMDEAFATLLKNAEDEPNKEPAQQLKDAKAKWEEFRRLFCRSVSTTYGGQWASTHESECRAKVANDFKRSMEGSGW
jgi:hypothetical protein